MTASKRNLVLSGFMGTGKSSVARGVARSLGRQFVDMDAVLTERMGMSIPDVFREQGEGAFRQHEAALCEELGAQSELVIATGGGALVDPSNREVMARNGCLVCLDCDVDELVRRLQGDQGRPMLWGENPEQRLRDLYRARQQAYAEIPYHIDTTYRTRDQVIDEVVKLFESDPTVWRVRTPTGSYQVYLIPGGLDRLGDILRAREISPHVAVVSDENVWPLYGQQVLDGLARSRCKASPIVLPAGEEHKTTDSVGVLYDHFVASNLDRSGAVIALGGGVITDMAGFAAATFMRGVPLLQVPTTLLGMVDASVGGKVAVDHPKGKNLIGAFVRPLAVMLDPLALDTLPKPEYRSGLAEVIKAGIIGDPELFERFEPGAEPPDVRWLLERALEVKIEVVEEDPYERGRRAVLNLGHTFAHAIEVLEDYQLGHGLAVSIGMVAAATLAEIRGLCSSRTRERIVAALRHHALPVSYDAHPPDAIYEAMRTDKKRRGAHLRFILPRDIGDVIIEADIPAEQVISALERIRA